jgi:5-formyltetrahydrofolate cyclo-ligase
MASSYGQDASKSSIRSLYLTTRSILPTKRKDEIDAAIRARLEDLSFWKDASLVLTYVSYRDEIDTRAIIEDALAQGKQVAVPRCDTASRSISFHLIDSLDDLEPGILGIPEPPADAPAVGLSDMLGSICLVPGLVFDGAGHRIGSGGGYYDRFLAFYPGDKIGLAHTMQLSSNPLPASESDVPVDLIVSDGCLWRCGIAELDTQMLG